MEYLAFAFFSGCLSALSIAQGMHHDTVLFWGARNTVLYIPFSLLHFLWDT